MVNTLEIEDSLKGKLKRLLLDSILSSSKIEEIVAHGSKIGHNLPGHYIILCNKPVPDRTTMKIGESFVWYNGTSSKLRARVTSHLRRSRKYSASSAIAVEPITAKEFDEQIANGAIKSKDVNYYKKVDKEDPKQGRFLNGINFNDYPDYSFKVAFIQSEFLADFLEKLFREEFGKPVLCQYAKR